MVQTGELIARTRSPRTRTSLAQDLRQLDVTQGMTLLVHSSLSSLGWVCGGPVAVIQALMDAVSETGTLVMPTFSSDYADPATRRDPGFPADWWPTLRDSMPAFDPEITPAYRMGCIPESFRTWPGVLRSSHPVSSFAAWGLHAEQIIANHPLDFPLGEDSPLARIYDRDGYVLLLGVGYDRSSSLHLAECRATGAKEVQRAAPILEDGQRVWKSFRDKVIGRAFFPQIGVEFECLERAKLGQVGSATARLFPHKALVDFAVEWFTGLHTGWGRSPVLRG